MIPFSRSLALTLALSATLGLVAVEPAWAGKHKKGVQDGALYQPGGMILHRKQVLDDPAPALDPKPKTSQQNQLLPVADSRNGKPTRINSPGGLKMHSLFE